MNNDNDFRNINKNIGELANILNSPEKKQAIERARSGLENTASKLPKTSKTQLEQIKRASKSMNELLNSPAFKQVMESANSPKSKAAMEAFTRSPITSQQREISDLIKNTSKPTNSNLKRLSELIGIPGSKLTADQIERLNQLRSLEIPTKTDNEIYEGIQYSSLDSGDNDKNKTSDTGNQSTNSIDDLDWNLAIREAVNYAAVYDDLDENRRESKLSQNVNYIPKQFNNLSDVQYFLSAIWGVISLNSDIYEKIRNTADMIGMLIWLLNYFHII